MNDTPPISFRLGRIVATPGALAALEASGQHPLAFLSRHASGDWGDICASDREENAVSVREGHRLLSAYTLRNGRRLWIMTESDRSVTTLLLPQEALVGFQGRRCAEVAQPHSCHPFLFEALIFQWS
jgi:hypothetical protein